MSISSSTLYESRKAEIHSKCKSPKTFDREPLKIRQRAACKILGKRSAAIVFPQRRADNRRPHG